MTDVRQDKIIDDFELFDEWIDKYNYLIELSSELPQIDATHRTEQYLIDGCQSRVWIDARLTDEGTIVFSADSDAIITKGIISLLIQVLNNRTPEQIINTKLYFIDQIGLSSNLSPTRANGLVSMINQMKLFALAYQNLNK